VPVSTASDCTHPHLRKSHSVAALYYVYLPRHVSVFSGVLYRPQEIHRLDAETGGLLVCAKTAPALRVLSAAFRQRAVKKRYRALVRGALDGCGRVTLELGGKACWTEFRAVAVHASALCGSVTTVDLWPHTGRLHQLRRHMALIGHPILGDVKYWFNKMHSRNVVVSCVGHGYERLAEAELIDAPGTSVHVPWAVRAWDSQGSSAMRSVSSAPGRLAAVVAEVNEAGAATDEVQRGVKEGLSAHNQGELRREGNVGSRVRRRSGKCSPPDVGAKRFRSAAGSAGDCSGGLEGEFAQTSCSGGVPASGNVATGGTHTEFSPSDEQVGDEAETTAAPLHMSGARALKAAASCGEMPALQQEAMAERMCLWALQCRFVHPVHGTSVNVCIDEPPLFQRTLAAHERGFIGSDEAFSSE
jgi:hypothetical protein